MSRSLAAAETGFLARLSGDATFQTLVGTDSGGALRLHNEYVGERTIGESATYRAVTVIRVTAAGWRRKTSGQVRLQSDIYVSQEYGGSLTAAKALLETIDARMLELVDEQQWRYEGLTGTVRLNGVALPERDPVGGHLRPLRRTREWLIAVSFLGEASTMDAEDWGLVTETVTSVEDLGVLV